MRPVILYRDFDIPSAELETAQEYFPCFHSRMDIQPNDSVLGRYSVLPFYVEQERDIKRVGATLINSYDQHNYVADLRRWYADLAAGTQLRGKLTPKTWMSAEEMMQDPYTGPYVVKGITNSKKFEWKTHMYAETKQDAIAVMCRLQQDTLISQQPIVFREYVPLKKLCDSVAGAPVSKEFRFFFCYGELLCGAFYWSSYTADLGTVPNADEVPLAFLGEVSRLVSPHVNFYVVDVAQTESGEWLVIELNDAQQSGLSDNDPDVLYRRLKEVVELRCR